MAAGSRRSRSQAQAATAKFVGFTIIIVMLAAGLLLGTESTLTLRRDDSGAVTAVNSWRIAGHLTLLKRTVRNLREVRMQQVSLTEQQRRSSAYRNAFGMLNVPEQMSLVGDSSLPYPYREDASLVRSFLKNTTRQEVTLRHPLDIRRQVSSWVLLVLAVLSIGGWIVKLVLGRDPLANAPNKVKPLPPKVGQAIFVGTIVILIWFFTAGHRVFGPVAPNKVRLLFQSASTDDAAGVEKAARRGVFLDVRDDQGTTALMVAARAGAAKATAALLKAGASPDVSDLSDNTPLMLARQGGHAAIAELLLAAGADDSR